MGREIVCANGTTYDGIGTPPVRIVAAMLAGSTLVPHPWG